MIITPAIANLIREGKTAQIYSAIQTGGQYSMKTMEMALRDLYLEDTITFENAMSKTSRPEELLRMIGGPPTAKPPAPGAARSAQTIVPGRRP